MFFDANTLKKLEMDRTLAGLEPVGPYGRDALDRQMPFMDSDLRERELDRVEAVVRLLRRDPKPLTQIMLVLSEMREIRGTLERLENGSVLSDIECFELKRFALSLARISALQYGGEWPDDLRAARPDGVLDLLDPRGEGIPAFHIYSEYSETLAGIREEIDRFQQHLEHALAARIAACRAEYGIPFGSAGRAHVSKEDPRSKALAEDPRILRIAESYGLVEYRVTAVSSNDGEAARLAQLHAAEQQESNRVMDRLCGQLRLEVGSLSEQVILIGRLDLTIAKARHALEEGLTRPQCSQDGIIRIQGGFNLPLKHRLAREGKDITPIDIAVGPGVTVITGSNMGGKSMTLKLIGQIAALAAWGCYVPAVSASVPTSAFVFLSAGDHQNLDRGLSSFAGEMEALSRIIGEADRGGLILIDELARGTNPQEGAALSRSIADALDRSNSITILTTHYDGVAKGKVHYRVRGLQEKTLSPETALDTLHTLMDYRLERTDETTRVPREAIPIAEMLGLRPDIIEGARAYLARQERSTTHAEQTES